MQLTPIEAHVLHADEKKNYGFTPNLDVNPLLTSDSLRSVQHEQGKKHEEEYGIKLVLRSQTLRVWLREASIK